MNTGNAVNIWYDIKNIALDVICYRRYGYIK